MKAATAHEIKKELKEMDRETLIQLCLRLSRFKKENKELLTYLIYESENEASYIDSIKVEVEELMKTARNHSLYLTKRSLRKIIRYIDRFIRYSGKKETETEVRLHFLQQIKASGIPVYRSRGLVNLYNGQVKKINASIEKLHEDLQYDYRIELDKIKTP